MSYVTNSFDDEIVGLLMTGGIGLLPTDTIYGLSCAALNRESVQKLHKIKRRDKTKPFVVLISRTNQLQDLGIVSTDAAPALRYWPGRLTMVLEAPKAPRWLQMNTGTLAVRQPDYTSLRQLIDKTGPIISTSANLSGGEPAKSAKQARDYFGRKLDFYVDTGRLAGKPSTIIKRDNYKFKVLRPGAVKFKEQ